MINKTTVFVRIYPLIASTSIAGGYMVYNQTDAASIKLNRYSEDVWTALPTTRTDEDTAYLYFESQTPGFSPFAITGQKKILVSPAVAETEAPTPTDAVTTPTEVEMPLEPTPGGKYLIFGVVALVTIAGVYLYMRKRQG